MRSCAGGDGRILLIGVPTVLLLMFLLVLAIVVKVEGQRLTPPRQYHSSKDDDDEAEENKKRTIHPKQASVMSDSEFDEEHGNHTDEKGRYVGAPCDEGNTCNEGLLHVVCNEATGFCECEKKYPVQLNSLTGCGKPKKLGEQCYYKETCEHADPQSSCIQIQHNAICQCKPGYHQVSFQKPTKREFCAEDLVQIATNFSTLAGVVFGIAVLSGLICFVLRLFNQNLYGTGRHRYGNANLAPPILFSSDADTSDPVYGSFTGSVPTILEQQRRPTAGSLSRASSQRTLASIRRPSSAPGYHSYQQTGSYHSRHSGSRAGSRRPSLTSVHSNNSVRSYSQRRYEREREQKEEREMQRRLAKLQQQQQVEVRTQQQKQRVVDALSAASGGAGSTAVSLPGGAAACVGTTEIEGSANEITGGAVESQSTDDLLPTLKEDSDTAVPIDIPLAITEESNSTSLHEEKPSTSKRFP